MQCNSFCSWTSKCFCVENTPIQFLCYDLRSIRKGTSERRGIGELCSIIIDHFRITFGLFFKASLGAHPFIGKLVLIHMQMKTNFHMKR